MALTQITTGGVDENINIDSNTLKVDGTNNRVGIGTTSPDGRLHVHSASAGSVTANAGADDLIVENNGDTGISILAADGNNTSAIFFGNATDAVGAAVRWNHNSNEMQIGPDKSGAHLRFNSGDGAERMRIDSSGNVIIGTTTAATDSRLTVRAVSPALSLYATPGNESFLNMGDTDDHNIGRITYDNSNNAMRFDTNAAERMRIDSSGNVGIGTSSPAQQAGIGLHIHNGGGQARLKITNNTVGATANDGTDFIAEENTDFHILNHENGALKLGTNDAERMRIDSSGNVGIGTSSPTKKLHIDSSSDQIRLSDGSGGFELRAGNVFKISDDGTERLRIDSSGRVGINETTPDARLDIGGDNADIRLGGSQYFRIKATSTGDLTFNDNDTNERARIDSDGNFLVGKNTLSDTAAGLSMRVGGVVAFEATVSSGASHCMMLNRQGDDGAFVKFRQANTLEGTITVSGSTVSYNGGHLARWSQLPSGAERTEILRGSVLSNLDEMCEWGEEDNEQLNRMKISDVEGDVNVSGVFQDWDDNDDTYTNDFYCAMTGDFVIRIAQGTTVARGDLLMSAGDGTAKPQDDDIVRSKTIAKVTSTTVSTTYSDGSYCVPCVLMAC